MDLLCPSCARQLTVPQAAPGLMLKCPYCQNVFQIAPAPAQAAPVAAGYPNGGSQQATRSVPGLPEGPIVTNRPRIKPRKKSNALGLVCAFVLLVGVVAGAAYLGTSLLKNKTSSSAPQQPTTPEGIASQQARQFLIKEALLPADVRFPPSDKVQHLAGGRWLVSSHVDVPARVGDVLVRQSWSADLTQADDGSWVLDQLKLDRDTLVASRNTNDSGWQSDLPQWNGRAMSHDNGPDRSTGWAVDRLAEEIQESVELGPTLVVWLIDRSMSARPQQQEFVQRLDKVLPKTNAASDKRAQMAVVSFGADVKFPLEEPTSDAQAIRQALEAVEEDQTGQEMTFQAIGMAVEKYRGFRMEHGGYVMLVVISDEVGDDEANLDETLKLVRQHGMTVSVVGVTAPFGRVVAPGQQSAEGAPQSGNAMRSLVRQGPESRYLEMIDLGFGSGGEAQAIESGFGPFSLTRLCQETGGTYYACRDFGVASMAQFSNWNGGDSRPNLDPQVLRRYAPDYVSEEEYRQILASNKACQAIHEAAKLPHADVLANVNTSFAKRDEAQFKRSLDTAGRDAAKLEPKIMAIYEVLKQGESDRAKLTRPRWQAAYDLAMGRVLAARVRTEGYNAMLARLKTGGNFTKPGATTWVLQEADTTGAGSIYEKMLEQSRTYLNRVVKDHPGTPWALLAQRQLQIKSGWQLTEN
jgi:hypothetical protein